MNKKVTKQTVYGLWAMEYNGHGRWLEWDDVKINSHPNYPHLGQQYDHHVYIFSKRKSDMVRVLRYIRGNDMTEERRKMADKLALAEYIYQDNTESIKVKKVTMAPPDEL